MGPGALMAIPPPPAESSMLSGAIPPPPDNPQGLKDSVNSDTPQLASVLGNSNGILARGIGYAMGGVDATRALLTNEPTQGMTESLIRGIPATTGAALAAVAASPSGPGAIAAAGLGGAGGEGARQSAVQLYSGMMGRTMAPAGTVLMNMGVQGAASAVGQAASPYVAAAVNKTAGAVGDAAKGAMRYAGVNLAGVKSGSYEIAQQGAGAVSKYVGADASVGDDLAQGIRDSISKAVSQGEAEYPRLIDAARANPAYAGKTIDLQKAVGDKVLEIADKHGFQSVPGLDATGEGDKFWRFAGQIDGLKNAPVEQVYNFQKQLNGLAQSNRGTALGSAFGQLKSAVNGVLGSEITEIGKANSAYAAAKALEEQTGKLTGNNDLLAYVTKTLQNPQSTLAKQALEDAAGKVPGLSDALSEIQRYSAAKSFEPLLRGVPATGYGAAALYGAGAGIHSAVKALGGDGLVELGAAGLAGAGAVVSSPRLALTALQASQAAGPSLTSLSRTAAQGIQGATPLLSQALGVMSTPSIEALYNRSMGRP